MTCLACTSNIGPKINNKSHKSPCQFLCPSQSIMFPFPKFPKVRHFPQQSAWLGELCATPQVSNGGQTIDRNTHKDYHKPRAPISCYNAITPRAINYLTIITYEDVHQAAAPLWGRRANTHQHQEQICHDYPARRRIPP